MRRSDGCGVFVPDHGLKILQGVVAHAHRQAALGFPAVAHVLVDRGFQEIERLVHDDVVFSRGLVVLFMEMAGGGMAGFGGGIGVDGDEPVGASSEWPLLAEGVFDQGNRFGFRSPLGGRGNRRDRTHEDVPVMGELLDFIARGRFEQHVNIIPGFCVCADDLKPHGRLLKKT